MVQEGQAPPASGAGICPSTGEPCDCGASGTGGSYYLFYFYSLKLILKYYVSFKRKK